ncbi:MAG: hypothetical protein FWG66_11065 [Spirochaetes bacterium]|nr:hypothetical protein [Spirochaetota bacterium]
MAKKNEAQGESEALKPDNPEAGAAAEAKAETKTEAEAEAKAEAKTGTAPKAEAETVFYAEAAGTVRIRNESLKGGRVLLANGETAVFDKDGIAGIDSAQAERLLRIPGYEKA